jgi:hypothetical protein
MAAITNGSKGLARVANGIWRLAAACEVLVFAGRGAYVRY